MNYLIPLRSNCLLTRYPLLIVPDQSFCFYKILHRVLAAHGYPTQLVMEKEVLPFLENANTAFHLISPKDFSQDSRFMKFFVNSNPKQTSIIVTNWQIKKFNFLVKKNWLSFFDKVQKIAEADYINPKINKRLQSAEV